jgi:RimJ/RimL family protein N-acetyltransferase
MTILQTRRLELNPISPDDAAWLVALHADPRVNTYVADGVIDRLDIARYAIAFVINQTKTCSTLGWWIATTRESGERIGFFSLMRLDGSADIEVGLRLAPCGWGRGYAVEGCEALVKRAFAEQPIALLWGTCHAGHRSVHHMFAQLGFSYVGMRAAYGTTLAAFHVANPQLGTPRRCLTRREAMAQERVWRPLIESSSSTIAAPQTTR